MRSVVVTTLTKQSLEADEDDPERAQGKWECTHRLGRRSENTEPGAIATAFTMVGINAGRVRSLSLPVLYPPNMMFVVCLSKAFAQEYKEE